MSSHSVKGRQTVPSIVIGIDLDGDESLAQVVHTNGAPALFLRPAQGGQQQRREDGDNGDNQEQLDQRKTISGWHAVAHTAASPKPIHTGRAEPCMRPAVWVYT